MANEITDETASAYYARLRYPVSGECRRCEGAGFLRAPGGAAVRPCPVCKPQAAVEEPIDAGPPPWAQGAMPWAK